MKIDVLATHESTLPAEDGHPYRTGAWQPQTVERRAWDLPVEGRIPDDLAGVYLRNTENPLHPAVRTYHPFDGDGMVHSIRFEGGEAVYHNRFVQTDALVAEAAARRPLYAGAAEPASAGERRGTGVLSALKDASSTDVVVHGGSALTSSYQGGELYRLDPITLAPQGTLRWPGFPDRGVAAHARVDEHTGELLWFSYGADTPYLQTGSVGPDGTLNYVTDVDLPGPRLPHDLAFTENYIIVNDCPLIPDAGALAAGKYAPRFHADIPTRFGLVPRGEQVEGGAAMWFEAEPTFVLHWVNAYEHGDQVILDGFFQNVPAPAPIRDASLEQNVFRFLDLHLLEVELRRWTFDLTTGQTTEQTLSDRVAEFGMINGTHAGREYRYAYNALMAKGWYGLLGVVKHDVATGTEEVFTFDEGVYCSETVMAPRVGATAEDDGYLLTFVSDTNNNTSSCVILDAANPSAGPIATVGLPERICSGTHAYWAPATAL